jgi:hypothetical protein
VKNVFAGGVDDRIGSKPDPLVIDETPRLPNDRTALI